jgi:hypothetical protein
MARLVRMYRLPDATEDAAVLTVVADTARRWRGGRKVGHP